MPASVSPVWCISALERTVADAGNVAECKIQASQLFEEVYETISNPSVVAVARMYPFLAALAHRIDKVPLPGMAKGSGHDDEPRLYLRGLEAAITVASMGDRSQVSAQCGFLPRPWSKRNDKRAAGREKRKLGIIERKRSEHCRVQFDSLSTNMEVPSSGWSVPKGNGGSRQDTQLTSRCPLVHATLYLYLISRVAPSRAPRHSSWHLGTGAVLGYRRVNCRQRQYPPCIPGSDCWRTQ